MSTELRGQRRAAPAVVGTDDATRVAVELGDEVRQLRLRRGWSQTQLAHAAGMTQSTVARFEAGGTVPTLPVLLRLAGALGRRLDIRFVR
ncbi:helix-turn-helix transcriptional regulator [Micromonospora yangpuensis]|uniref:Helix-turn-helix n=1 Tax=Micromonospora yangpuensis TaxID=683228 RepID=A0A1C6U862_9ACTN|nr:helix-turn-helix transcriptional regulator [Micromonospora yangpuensis]GGL89594.1 hypothetical protein GCM10012279_04030 [Micromonospora yangpuensis]SCL50207.1 Helix-turn-helix [Micromonospora yangpuensis]